MSRVLTLRNGKKDAKKEETYSKINNANVDSKYNSTIEENSTIYKVGYDTIKLYTKGGIYNDIKNALANNSITMKIRGKSKCGKYVNRASIIYQGAKIRFGFYQSTTISFEPATFFYENNLHLAGVKETENAIRILSNLLQVPMYTIGFSRLDITANFYMKQPMSYYTKKFTHPAYLKRREDNLDEKGKAKGNVIFGNSNRWVSAYVKRDNIMRIESKIQDDGMRYIHRNFKFDNAATNLYNKLFFERAIADYTEKIIGGMCKKNSCYLSSIIEQADKYKQKSLQVA